MTAGTAQQPVTGPDAVRRDADASSRPELVRAAYQVLDEIHDPCSVASSVPMGLAEMGIIGRVEVSRTGAAHVTLRLTSPFCEMIGFLRSESLRRVAELPGVTGCVVDHDNGMHWDDDLIAPAAADRRRLRLLAVRREHESAVSRTQGAPA